MSQSNVRIACYAGILGAALWIVNEALLLMAGAQSATGLWISILAFLGVAAGLWGIHGTYDDVGSGNLSFMGAAMGSLGMLALAVQAYRLTGLDGMDLNAFSGSPLATSGLLLFAAGGFLIGVSALGSGIYPTWAGLTFLAATLATVGLELWQLMPAGRGVAHIVLAAVLMYMAWRGGIAGRAAAA